MPGLLDAPPRRRPPGSAPPPDRPGAAEEWAERLGGIDPARVLTDPPPGAATEADHARVQGRGGARYELIDGTLVRKAPMSWFAGSLALELGKLLGNWLDARPAPDGTRRGQMAGPDGFTRLTGGRPIRPRLRAPDVSYVSRDRFPGGVVPRTGYPTLAPDLVIEVLSPGNPEEEMREKRGNYFDAGTLRVWQIDPLAAPPKSTTPPPRTEPAAVPAGGTLDAGAALPGFAVALVDLFAAADGWA